MSVENAKQEIENPPIAIPIESSRFFVSPTEAVLTDNTDTISTDKMDTISVDKYETTSTENFESNSVDNFDAISVAETPSRKISTETFVGKISVDEDSVSSVSTIDYRPYVITTAEIHRQIDDVEEIDRQVKNDVDKIHRHIDVDDTESEFSEEGTTESYSDDDDERRHSIHSIPSSLNR